MVNVSGEYKMCDCSCEPQQYCYYTPKHRHFLSKDEEVENLKTYKKELEKEMKGVDERIKEISL
jgi:hypothetical protein